MNYTLLKFNSEKSIFCDIIRLLEKKLYMSSWKKNSLGLWILGAASGHRFNKRTAKSVHRNKYDLKHFFIENTNVTPKDDLQMRTRGIIYDEKARHKNTKAL